MYTLTSAQHIKMLLSALGKDDNIQFWKLIRSQHNGVFCWITRNHFYRKFEIKPSKLRRTIDKLLKVGILQQSHGLTEESNETENINSISAFLFGDADKLIVRTRQMFRLATSSITIDFNSLEPGSGHDLKPITSSLRTLDLGTLDLTDDNTRNIFRLLSHRHSIQFFQIYSLINRYDFSSLHGFDPSDKFIPYRVLKPFSESVGTAFIVDSHVRELANLGLIQFKYCKNQLGKLELYLATTYDALTFQLQPIEVNENIKQINEDEYIFEYRP